MDDGVIAEEEVRLKRVFLNPKNQKNKKNFYSLMKSKIYKNKKRFITNRFLNVILFAVINRFPKMNSACIIQCALSTIMSGTMNIPIKKPKSFNPKYNPPSVINGFAYDCRQRFLALYTGV